MEIRDQSSFRVRRFFFFLTDFVGDASFEAASTFVAPVPLPFPFPATALADAVFFFLVLVLAAGAAALSDFVGLG